MGGPVSRHAGASTAPGRTAATSTARLPSARRHTLLVVVALFVLVGGFGAWATMASISGAVVSSGRVAVDSNRQVVQHPDGGVVLDILVHEGDRVAEGQTLIRVDPSPLSSQRRILSDRLDEVSARASRLVAERQGDDAVGFPPDLLAAAARSAGTADIVAGQRNLFEARREARGRETAQLDRRKEQIGSQVDGIAAQREAITLQLGFLREELDAQRSLLVRGLTQAPRVLGLQREEARLLGQVGELAATVAELQGRTTEIDLEILKIETADRDEAIAELREVQPQQVELTEQIRALDERLSRLSVTAPVDGVVYDMKVFARRSVIRPADPVLYIVPQDRPLVIQARVDPIHVDQVFPGQPVTLRLPTFDARLTPELAGTVVRLSPDAFTDQATGQTYYQAEILPDPGETDKLGNQALLPGMPVEAFLRTQDRSPISYFVKPLMDYFYRAFRE